MKLKNIPRSFKLLRRTYLAFKLVKADPITRLAIAKLDNRFDKINPSKYYLSYSGGNDSEIVRAYIEFRNLPIMVISANTYREHREIRDRMFKNADLVVYPEKTFEEIYDEWGAPCFTKQQDEYIHRYQTGNRSENTMKAVRGGHGSKFQLNEKARKLTLTEQLHKVSNMCCVFTKERPVIKAGKAHGRPNAIVCVRGAESITRDAQFSSCMKANGDFQPIHDFYKKMMKALADFFEIDELMVYDFLDRTGCIGCPYGRNIEAELKVVTPAQKAYAVKSFKQSYDVKGVNYKDTQLSIFDIEKDD